MAAAWKEWRAPEEARDENRGDFAYHIPSGALLLVEILIPEEIVVVSETEAVERVVDSRWGYFPRGKWNRG
jgi:hypothetical protein